QMRSSRLAIISSVVLCVLLGTFSYLCVDHLHPFGLEPEQLKQKLLRIFYYPLIRQFDYVIRSPSFWIALGVTLTLERLIPAQPQQKALSLSFAQDFVWSFYEGILQAFIIVTYVALLRKGYEQYFPGLTITYANHLPGWMRFLFAQLLFDFLFWVQHYLNHKVPLFWKFHKIHHSQKDLNFFTDFRYHVVEYIVRQTVLVPPFLIFNITSPDIFAFVLFSRWYFCFYHSNIRTNLGPLRYLLVTPQSHRVHHSLEQQHFNTNFGSLFCIWDFIFRT